MTLDAHRRDEGAEVPDAGSRRAQVEAVAELYGIDPRMVPGYPEFAEDAVTRYYNEANYVPEFLRPGIDPTTIPDAPMCQSCNKTHCEWCVNPRCPTCRWPLLTGGWCSMCAAADVQGLPGIVDPSSEDSDKPPDTDA